MKLRSVRFLALLMILALMVPALAAPASAMVTPTQTLETDPAAETETPRDLVPMSAAAQAEAANRVASTAVPTEAEAYAAMIAFKSSYPEGLRYTNDDYYGWNGGIFTGGYGCAGFAFMLSDAAFGDLPARQIYDVSFDKVHVGDILRVNNNSHSVIIMERYSNYVVLAEANYNSSVHWGRTMTVSEVENATYLMTRYPVGTFGKAFTITYDANGGTYAPEREIYEEGTAAYVTTDVAYRRFYDFLGWSTSPTATTATYHAGDRINLTGDITLYAVWSQNFQQLANTFPKTYNVTIAQSGSEVYYKFIPTATADYTFESSDPEGTADPKIYVYDEMESVLGYNDDGGEGYHFLLTVTLEAKKTYYVAVSMWSSGTGSFSMTVSRANVQGPSITGHPGTKTVVEGQTAKFGVIATGTGLTYQWQYQMPGNTTWTNTTLATAKKATLEVPATLARSGCKYRCKVTDSSGMTVFTNAATLTVKSAVKITGHPGTKTVDAGKDAKFGVIADGAGLTYQWQYKAKGGTTWTNTTLTGAKTSLLTVPATAARNGCQYRCIVTDAAGNKATSNAATLTVKSIVSITGHPGTKTVAEGLEAKFGLVATGDGLTYQWQYQMPGSTTWTNTTLTGAKTSLLTVPATAARNGCKYRCKVTDAYGNVAYTNAATLTVKSLKITGHPTAKAVVVGMDAKFGVIAEGVGLTYQWQFKMPGGDWTNTTLTGAKTSLLTVPATIARSACQYRCIVTDAAGTKVTSNVATLTVKLPVTVTGNPTSKTVTAGTTVKFTVTADGAGLSYQWQYKQPGGVWTNTTLTGAKTATLTVAATAARNGCQYRCIVTDAAGNTDMSNVVTLTVK